MSEPRVGIVGAGWAARVIHLPGLRAAGMPVAAICDTNPAPARKLADEYGIPSVHSDWREMLAKERLDAVSVCVPNRYHRDITVAALHAGAHVLCEKPLAASLAEAREMFAAAARKGRILMVAQSWRFGAAATAIKRVTEAGELGDIYYGEATALRRMGIPAWGTFHQAALAVGGALLDIGVHMLDLAVWLMGNPQPARVSAATERRFGTRPEIAKMARNAWDPARFDVEDFAVAMVRFATGGTLVLRAAWAAHIEREEFAVRLCGTKGGAITSPPTLFYNHHGRPADERFQLVDTPMYEREMAHWARVLRGEAEPLVRPEETLNVQAILDAAYRSAADGCEVAVEPA